jgi:membrane associated rhomboid family serine protease
MTFRQQSGDYAPWFHIRGFPVHSVEMLMGLYLVSMIATTVAIALGHGATVDVLRYDTSAVFQHGEIWRLFTYAFWNQPNIPFLLELTVYFFFGRELERFFGRTAFIYLYAILFVASPILGILCIPFQNVVFSGIPCGTGLFVAFATMAPAVTLFLGISAKWLAITFVGIRILSAIASHDWAQVTVEGGGAIVAFLTTRYFQGRWVIDALSVFKRNRFQVIQGGLNEKSSRPLRAERTADSPESSRLAQSQGTALLESNEPSQTNGETHQEVIDRILEKISASGISSISPEERSLLETARKRLLLRDSPARR